MNIVAEKVCFSLYPNETGPETLLTQCCLSVGEGGKNKTLKKKGRKISLKCRATICKKNPFLWASEGGGDLH